MNLDDLKLVNLKIKKEEFGRIYSFVDFGNVDYWYESDRAGLDDNSLKEDEKLNVDILKLYNFCCLFSRNSKFYYGLDQKNKKSWHIAFLARQYFGKSNTITKQIQRIKHYLDSRDVSTNTRPKNYDATGCYVYILKCNFDVEICIDAIRLIDKYDTFCLFSSDSDFSSLLRYLKERKKKIILVKSGFVSHYLVKQADLVINAQDVKSYITFIKQKSRQ